MIGDNNCKQLLNYFKLWLLFLAKSGFETVSINAIISFFNWWWCRYSFWFWRTRCMKHSDSSFNNTITDTMFMSYRNDCATIIHWINQIIKHKRDSEMFTNDWSFNDPWPSISLFVFNIIIQYEQSRIITVFIQNNSILLNLEQSVDDLLFECMSFLIHDYYNYLNHYWWCITSHW